MKRAVGLLLFLGLVSVSTADQKEAPPPACQDEEAMVADYTRTLTEMVGTVRKESLEDFQRAFHRKSCLTKLTLCASMVAGAESCFEHAAQDRSTPKNQAAAYKTKHDAYTKLKDRVAEYRDLLKATEADKDAKALIEKMDFTE